MSFALLASPSLGAAAGGHHRRGIKSISLTSSTSNRRSSGVVVAVRATKQKASDDGGATEEVEPDGVLSEAPEGIPMEEPEPPTPASSSVAPPLACPVSLQPLDARGFAKSSGLQYGKVEDAFWDLTIGAAINAKSPNPTSLTDVARSLLPRELRGILPQSSYLGTSTFETPQVAFAYERGWRDSFKRAGFPGPDEEFKLAEGKLLPRAQGRVLVDASCGSGLFTRRFVKSGNYGSVVALDFSEAMLMQARQFFKDEGLLAEGGDPEGGDREDVAFVRADIARIPFPEGTVGGVHAGAAIHCWPEPRAAVAEIARVLEPGATFCGTTFLTPKLPFGDDATQQAVDAALRELQEVVAGRVGGPRGFRQWNKKDLAELCAECGLVDFDCDVRGGFIFYSAKKPEAFD